MTSCLKACSIFLLGMMVIATTSNLAFARPKVVLDANGIPVAAPEAVVDRVAHSYQKDAVVRLKKLLAASKPGDQQAKLTLRLAQLQQNEADIVFRIAHMDAYKSKKPIDLKAYRGVQKESVATLSDLIKKYPTYKELPQAYLLRAKGYQELDDKASASKDYRAIELQYPNFDGIRSVYFELAELAEERQDYPTQIKYLLNLEAKREDVDRYAYALYKLAWANYRMDNVERAMSYVKSHTKFQNEQIRKLPKSSKDAQPVYQTRRDELLLDATIFYLRAYELKQPAYAVTNGLTYFKSLTSGPNVDEALSEMIVKFATLLRANGHSQDLVTWKNEVLQSNHAKPEALRVILVVYEDQLNKYAYTGMWHTVGDIIALYKSHRKDYSFKPAEKTLVESAERIQKGLSKNKTAQNPEGVDMTSVLERVYKGVLEIADIKEAGAIKMRYNLAEALVGLNKTEEAAAHYRWIFENKKLSDQALASSGVGALDAGLKAMGIQYESLKSKKIIPDDLKPQKFEDLSNAKLDSTYEQWVALLKQADSYDMKADRRERIAFFNFEANRALYAQGKVKDAVAKMMGFAKSYADTKYAIPTVRLIMDTLIASQMWKEVEEYANVYVDYPGIAKTEFSKELLVLASDASYKLAEAQYNSGDYKGVLNHSDAFVKKYPFSKRKEDMMALVGKSALALNNDQVANEYLTKIVEELPSSRYYGSSLLLRASMSEKNYQFTSAATDFRKFLTLPAARREKTDVRDDDLRKKIILLTWVSEDWRKVNELLKDPAICTAALAAFCDQYQAYLVLKGERHRNPWKGKPKFNKSLWTMVDIEFGHRVSIQERIERFALIARNWGEMDPLIRFSLVPRINEDIAGTLSTMREEVRHSVRLKADPQVIKKRLKLVQTIEASAAQLMKLPFAKIQVLVLNHVASLYMDLAADIKALPPQGKMSEEEHQIYVATIKKVAEPFENNGKKLRFQAFEAASKTGIETDTFQDIAKQLFAESPELVGRLLPSGELPTVTVVSTKVLDEINMDDLRSGFSKENQDAGEKLRDAWMKALEEQKWGRVAYFLYEARRKNLMNKGVLNVMEAISLASIGARAEGLSELEQTLEQFQKMDRKRLTLAMIKFYMNTLSREKVIALMKKLEGSEIPSGLLDKKEMTILASWSNNGAAAKGKTE